MTPECKIPTIILIIFLQGCGGANSENPTSASLTTSHQQQISSEPPTTPISPGNQFSANVDYIFKDGERLDIKAMVYVVGEPGYLPWDIEVMPELPAVLQARIDYPFATILQPTPVDNGFELTELSEAQI